MKKFKLPIIILSICLILSSTGCGIDKKEVANSEIIQNTSSPSDTTQTNSEKPSENPTVESPDASSTTVAKTKDSENKDSSDELDMGSNEGSTYKNNFFGMTIQIPKDWKISSDEEKQKLLNVGKQAIAGDDKLEKTKLDLSELRTVYLLMTSKYGTEKQSANNPNFMSMAEKLSLIQGVNKPEEYLYAVKKQLQAVTTIKYKLDKAIYPEEVGGKQFQVLEAVVELGQMKMTQKYYATIMKDYALCFVTTSTEKIGAKELSDMIKSIKFK